MKITPLEAVRNRRVEGKAAARGVSISSRRRLPCGWPPVQGMMLMHRANLREATLRSRPGHTDPDEFDIVGDSDDSDNYD